MFGRHRLIAASHRWQANFNDSGSPEADQRHQWSYGCSSVRRALVTDCYRAMTIDIFQKLIAGDEGKRLQRHVAGEGLACIPIIQYHDGRHGADDRHQRHVAHHRSRHLRRSGCSSAAGVPHYRSGAALRCKSHASPQLANGGAYVSINGNPSLSPAAIKRWFVSTPPVDDQQISFCKRIVHLIMETFPPISPPLMGSSIRNVMAEQVRQLFGFLRWRTPSFRPICWLSAFRGPASMARCRRRSDPAAPADRDYRYCRHDTLYRRQALNRIGEQAMEDFINFSLHRVAPAERPEARLQHCSDRQSR